MLVSWTPTTWNRHLVRAYKIGYRHISTRGKWTKQYFVTVGAGATTATIKQQIFKSTWEAAVVMRTMRVPAQGGEAGEDQEESSADGIRRSLSSGRAARSNG